MKKLLLGMLALGMCGTALAADPVFPSEFNVTADSKTVEIEQLAEDDYDIPTIQVVGTTTKAELAVTIDVPEGWDGFIGSIMMRGGMKQFAAWVPVESFIANFGEENIIKGNVFFFPADGIPSVALLYPYVDGQVDTSCALMLGVTVEQVEAKDPVFPEIFNVTTDSDQAVVYQEYDEDFECPTIQVTGTSVNETIALTFDLPEGWDGVIGNVMYRGGFKDYLPSAWTPMDVFEERLEGADIKKGTTLEFPADGVTSVGFYYLYSGDRVDTANRFCIAVMVDKVDAPEPVDPVFPETFNVSVDGDGMTIVQEYDDVFECPTIQVSGNSMNETVKLTFDLPEGWDGVIGNVWMRGGFKEFLPSEWTSIEGFEADLEGADIQKGKTLEFPADGLTSVGFYYLYAGDKVDTANCFCIAVMVDKVDAPEPVDPVFPETFNVSVDGDGMTIVQEYDDVFECPTIQVSGNSMNEIVKLTFDLPEGWDGVIGNVWMRGGFKEFVPSEWTSIEDFEAGLEGADIQKGTTLEFPADGLTSVGFYYLYAGDKVDTANRFCIAVLVDHDTTGIAAVGTEEIAPRYFNLYGVEIEKPEAGIYVKVTGDKAEKILVK